jgi:hypothetical protein
LRRIFDKTGVEYSTKLKRRTFKRDGTPVSDVVTNYPYAGPLSLSELSRSLGYKSIPKRLSTAIESMVREGAVAKVATGGLRTKIALIVR